MPSAFDTQTAQRLAARHARVLNEFGFISAEQLADSNQSRAANRNALADNWKKRRQVVAVRHRDESGKQREVFPLFQFDDHKPIKVVQGVLAAFGERKGAVEDCAVVHLEQWLARGAGTTGGPAGLGAGRRGAGGSA